MTLSSLLLLYILLAAGLAASLFLFFSLKRELQLSIRRQQERLDRMTRRLLEAEPPAPVVVEAPRLLQAGFNMNKRVQAMRMLRRGEDVAHIAAAMGVPRAEVELLIRVQSLSSAAAAGVASQDGGALLSRAIKTRES